MEGATIVSVLVGVVAGLLFGVFVAARLISHIRDPYPLLERELLKTAIPVILGFGVDSAGTAILSAANVYKLQLHLVIYGYFGTIFLLIVVPLAVVLQKAHSWAKNLSYRQRLAIVYRFVDKLPEKDCAERLGVSVEEFRKILAEALDKLDDAN